MLAGVGLALTLAASTAQAGGHDAAGNHGPGRPAAVRHYVVRPGDTLWRIASRLAGPGADPRPVLDSLEQVNHLDGDLAVGARLVLPA